MRIFRSQIILGVILAIFLAGILIVGVSERQDPVPVEAQTQQLAELEGWAWAGVNTPNPPTHTHPPGGVGWISFNSTNNPGGSLRAFAVKYNPISGGMSGHAWAAESTAGGSGGYGWLSFNRSETGNPPSAQPDPCASRPLAGDTLRPIACLSGNAIEGWARFLSACAAAPSPPDPRTCTRSNSETNSGGWDGWVRMSGTTLFSGAPYGGIFSGVVLTGYAWGSDNVGWISFSDPAGGCPAPLGTGKYCVKKKYDFSLSTGIGVSVERGGFETIAVNVQQIAGTPQDIDFSYSISGNPAGVTISFSPVSCKPEPVCVTTATIRTTSVSPTGDFIVTVTGTDEDMWSKTTMFKLNIYDNPFCAYYLTNSREEGGNIVVEQGNNAVVQIYFWLKEGAVCPQVPFTIEGAPSTVSFAPVAVPAGSTAFASTLMLGTTGVSANTYAIRVRGNPVGGPREDTNFFLVVTPPPCATCTQGDFTFTHTPYGEGEECPGGQPCIVMHPHFIRDISVTTSLSTYTLLEIHPRDDFNDTITISVVDDIQRDDGPATASQNVCNPFTAPCAANGVGDVRDGSNPGAGVPLNQFTFKFNERVGTQITGVPPNVPVLFNLIRETAVDGRYIIHLRATATNDPSKVQDTYLVLVIGSSIPGYIEI